MMATGDSAADRASPFVLVALILPGLAAVAWELWYAAERSESHGHGQLLLVYGMYGVGVILWCALRLVVPRDLALIAAVSVLFLGLPIGAALASVGPLSLAGLLFGIGGIVASLGFPGRPRGNAAID